MNSAKTALCVAAFLWTGAAAADEPATIARIAGVEIAVDEHGKPARVDEQKRRQILDNLRASFARRGIPARTGAPVISRSGASRITVGLDLSLISVARVAHDGTLETRCVQGAEHAAEFLAAAEER